jgi:hypothetical protein
MRCGDGDRLNAGGPSSAELRPPARWYPKRTPACEPVREIPVSALAALRSFR